MKLENEIWKSVIGYVGYYDVSNKGRVRSLDVYVKCRGGKLKLKKGRVLKQCPSGSGYLKVVLCKKGVMKNKQTHQLVCESFLNHNPNGHSLVVNHKDFDKKNNNLSNLEIVTQRENSNLKHKKSTSKYTGVCWNKSAKKWYSQINIKSKIFSLGYYDNELDAHKAYLKRVEQLKDVESAKKLYDRLTVNN